ncbi:MAG: RND family transporter [bacterium]
MTESDFTTQYANWVYKYRWYILILSLAVVLGVGKAASNLVFDTSYRIWFDKNDSWLIDYDEFENSFGSDEAIIISFKEPKGIFSNKALESIKRITAALWKTKRIVKVDSLTNYQWTHAEGDDLIVEDLVDKLPLSQAELERKKRIALKETMVNGLLLSADGTTTQIVAKLQLEEDPGNTHNLQARKAVEKIIASENTGYRYYLQGGPIIDTSFEIYSQKDMRVMIPLLFGVITLVLIFLFRSFWGTLMPLLVVAFSIMATMGLAALYGIKLNPLTASTPQIVLAIGIADAIHVITSFMRQLKQGVERKEALIYTIEKNLKPCFLTSLTTAVGFFSLLISKIGPLRYLGIMCGTGAVAAFFITFLFLTSMMAVAPFSAKLKKRADSQGWTEKPSGFVIKHARAILVFSIAAAFIIMYFAKNVTINNNPILYFKEGTMIRDSNNFIEKNMTGNDGMSFVIDSGKADGVKNPLFLKEMERLQTYLGKLPQVAKVTSLVDIVKQLNRSLHGDDQAYYRLPDTQELTAQYLFLYTLSLPLGKDLNDTINVDYSRTNMNVVIWNQSSSENLKLIEEIQSWIKKNVPDLKVKVVGKTVMFSYMQINLTNSFTRSILFALILVTLIMVATFRSVKLGLLSMVPNMIPLMLTAGIMGIFHMFLDAGTTMVGCVAIGIAVDDTIHFLSKYQLGLKQGMDKIAAVRYVYREAATAIIFTSVVLVLGFGVFILSQFKLNINFGVFTAIVLFFAVLCDLFVLPSILLWKKPAPLS